MILVTRRSLSIIERFGIRNRIQVIQYELNNSFEWYTRRCIFIPLSGSSDFPQTIHVDCGKTITCSTQQHNETDATAKIYNIIDPKRAKIAFSKVCK